MPLMTYDVNILASENVRTSAPRRLRPRSSTRSPGNVAAKSRNSMEVLIGTAFFEWRLEAINQETQLSCAPSWSVYANMAGEQQIVELVSCQLKFVSKLGR